MIFAMKNQAKNMDNYANFSLLSHYQKMAFLFQKGHCTGDCLPAAAQLFQRGKEIEDMLDYQFLGVVCPHKAKGGVEEFNFRGVSGKE
jgi:hypothetical protein